VDICRLPLAVARRVFSGIVARHRRLFKPGIIELPDPFPGLHADIVPVGHRVAVKVRPGQASSQRPPVVEIHRVDAVEGFVPGAEIGEGVVLVVSGGRRQLNAIGPAVRDYGNIRIHHRNNHVPLIINEAFIMNAVLAVRFHLEKGVGGNSADGCVNLIGQFRSVRLNQAVILCIFERSSRELDDMPIGKRELSESSEK